MSAWQYNSSGPIQNIKVTINHVVILSYVMSSVLIVKKTLTIVLFSQ